MYVIQVFEVEYKMRLNCMLHLQVISYVTTATEESYMY